MKKITTSIVLIITFFIFSGCAQLTEISKTLWGSSTRVLERERFNGISRMFECEYNECFQAVLSMAQENRVDVLKEDREEGEEESIDPLAGSMTRKDTFNIFMKNPQEGFIVVMGVPGAVDTTEVGIFLTEIGDKIVKVEISSLASNAKRKVGEIVFEELGSRFKEVY